MVLFYVSIKTKTIRVIVLIILEKNFKKFSNKEINDLIEKIKGIVYVRVSTIDQGEKGYSLESQVERCIELGKKKFGYKEEEFIVLIEAGEMGDNPNRPALNYAIELLEEGVGKKLFVLHPDRLSRYLNLQTQVSTRVWNAGCDLEFVEIDLDKDNPESMLMYNIQGSIAQYNKAKILANSRRGRITKAKNGKMSGLRQIYGYNFDKKNDILVTNEEEKKVFMEMVDMLLNKNMSCSRIAKELSIRGIPAPRSDVWYQATVTRILQNETYTGTFYYGKTEVVQTGDGKKKQVPKPRDQWIAIPVPQFITMNTHEKIKDKISDLQTNKSGRPSDDYLLRGIARCGRCGAGVSSGVTSKVKSGIYKYYACVHKGKKGYIVGTGEVNKRCEGRNWRVDVVDEYVWDKLASWLKNPEPLIEEIFNDEGSSSKISEAEERIKELEKSKKEKEDEKKRYIKLYATQSGLIESEEELAEYVDPINEQLNYINDDLIIYNNILNTIKEEESNKDKIANYIQAFNDSLSGAELLPEKKKEILNLFIDRVILHEDNTIEIFTSFKVNDEDESANRHKNQNVRQGKGLSIYATFSEDLPEPERMDGEYEWKKYAHEWDKVYDMHFNQLMTIGDISKETKINEWIIRDLFKNKGVKKLSFPELSKRRRDRDFDLLYDLHYKKKLSLNEIHRRYGHSPLYIKRTFKDKNVKHRGLVNQHTE